MGLKFAIRYKSEANRPIRFKKGKFKMSNKVLHGQFYTITNPFGFDPVFQWVNLMRESDCVAFQSKWLEPFAGANNIVNMINDTGWKTAINDNWDCFDIAPMSQAKNTSGVVVQKRDTLTSFPRGYKVAITNPPYLAKNSATRKNLPFLDTHYEDLYQVSLLQMLDNCDWVAAIIPDSFTTQGLFHNRLWATVTLTARMFADTEVPVCLALFVPENIKHDNNFDLYRNNVFLGSYDDIAQKCDIIKPENHYGVAFNDKNGAIGLRAVDGTSGPTIKFVLGKTIPSEDISAKNRAITRISANADFDVDMVVNIANHLLEDYRKKTNDVFLTSFKGLRKDDKYRRRLDWATARNIIEKAIDNYFYNCNNKLVA